MKTFTLVLSFIGIFGLGTKITKVESKVYSFSKAEVVKTEGGEKRQLLEGSTTHLENFEIHTTTLKPGATVQGRYTNTKFEELVFVKEGRLKVTLNNKSKVVGPGSVALILPGDEYGIENESNQQTTYYIIKYKSRNPMDLAKGKNAGGSILLDWDELKFSPHDKGGVRKYFDRKSSMSDRIEMHVTTLNPEIKSHEPHVHEPAEIVIMMEGTTEMEIGEGIYPGVAGDIYFLGSGIPHAIKNTGTEPCMYLAFQWE